MKVVCPACRGALRDDGEMLRCTSCAATYPQQGGVPILLDEAEQQQRRQIEAERAVSSDAYSFYRRHSPITASYYQDWVDRMFGLVPPEEPGPLLELMAGEGEIVRRFPRRFTEAAALDIDLQALQGAAAALADAAEQVSVVCGTALRLPFPDASFGLVMVQGGLHHVRSGLQQVLGEVERVLRPGGVLVGSEPANDNLLLRGVRRLQYALSPHQGHDEGEDGFTRAELGQSLLGAGLHLEHYETFGYIAYALAGNMDLLPLLHPLRNQAALGWVLARFDELIERTRLPGWASLFRARKH